MLTIDPLAYLPRVQPVDYAKRREIYGASNTRIHVVISGVVKVSRVTAAGPEIVIGLYKEDDIFGEAALVEPPLNGRATAFTAATVMSWDATQIQSLCVMRPHLGLALVRLVSQRQIDMSSRLYSLAAERIKDRLRTALVQLAAQIGTPSEESVILPPLTHEFLSQYIGTSREIVTHYMNVFRREGQLYFDRRGITIPLSMAEEIRVSAAAA